MAFETMPLAEMKTYPGCDPRPADFEEFWKGQTDTLSAQPVSYALADADFQVKGLKCSDLYFSSFDRSRIHCKVACPDSPGKLPVLFYFHGYKSSSLEWWHKIFWAQRGYCVIAMDVRGQAGPSQDLTSGFGSTSIGQLAAGIQGDKEDMTFLKIIKDIICLVNVVKRLPGVDPEDLAVHGGSQGGALSLITAALFPQVKKAAVMFPFLSDFRRMYQLDPRGGAYEELFYIFRFHDPLHEREEEYFQKLAYIDVKNFAPMITAEVIMATGLKDDVCPASSHFAVYNNLTCRKQLKIYPDFGHEDFLPGYTDICCQFLQR